MMSARQHHHNTNQSNLFVTTSDDEASMSVTTHSKHGVLTIWLAIDAGRIILRHLGTRQVLSVQIRSTLVRSVQVRSTPFDGDSVILCEFDLY